MMQKRIAFIGAPGSGKSTCATEVFTELKKKNYNAELVTEWIRNDIHQHGSLTSISEQYRTRFHQKEIEDAIPSVVEWVITDSGTLTPYFYSALYARNDEPRERIFLSDMFKFLIDDIYTKRYYKIFFLPSTQTYDKNKDILNDGTRFQNQEEVVKLNQLMQTLLIDFHNPGNIFKVDVDLNLRAKYVLENILS